MSKKRRTAESAAVTAEPPAKTLVQPALQRFKGFVPLDTVELRSGRSVKKKTSIKSSGGSFKHKDFTITNGVLDIHAAVKPNDARHRKRAGTLLLKPSNKQYKMKKSKMQALLKDFPHLESVSSECGIVFLRCGACRDFVIDSKSKACPGHVKEHMGTQKHKTSVQHEADALSHEVSVKSAFKVATATPGDKTNIFRARLVETFVGAGIPIQKIDDCRPFLEHYCNERLTDSAHLRKLVPTLRDAQRQEIKDALRLYPIFLVHDGTNRFSEFYAVVVRWVCDRLQLHERLVDMQAFTGKHNAAGLVAMLDALLRALDVDPGSSFTNPPIPSRLLGCQRDREATNALAAEGITRIYACSFNLECCSHALNKVGENLSTPHLVAFKDMLTIACNSAAFKEHLKAYVPKAFRKPSNIRWWSIWELYASMCEEHNGVPVFNLYLEACRASRDATGRIVIAGATEDSVRIGRLADFANNAAAVDAVRLELVAVVSIGKPFVQATYALEGAGCCSMEAYKWLQDLRYWLSPARQGDLSFPGLRAQIDASAQVRLPSYDESLDQARAAVEQEIRLMIRPALEFCQRVFDVEMAADFEMYEFFSSLNPFEHTSYFQHNSLAQWSSALQKHFGERFTQHQMDNMLAELPTLERHVEGFMAERLRMQDTSNDSDSRNKQIWLFWQFLLNNGDCPHLRSLTQLVLTIVPSSASCERCFSLLKSMFTTQQLVGEVRGVLEDNIGLSIAAKFRSNNLKNAFHRHSEE